MSPTTFRKLPLVRAWFQRSDATGRLVLTEERRDPTHDLVLTCTFPLVANGRVDTS